MKREVLDALAAPFPPESIGKKPAISCRACELPDIECGVHAKVECAECGQTLTEAHTHLDFVGHAYVRERFNEVDPDWNWAPMAVDAVGLPVLDENRGLWISLTLGGKTMLGYGDAPGKRGGNAIKEAIGDALRNAGQSFGVALAMWKRERPLRLVEPANPVASEEQRAKQLREEIVKVGRRKKKSMTFVQSVGAFNRWANGMHEFREAPAEVLADYLTQLKAGRAA